LKQGKIENCKNAQIEFPKLNTSRLDANLALSPSNIILTNLESTYYQKPPFQNTGVKKELTQRKMSQREEAGTSIGNRY
jgi:hypothetical protein